MLSFNKKLKKLGLISLTSLVAISPIFSDTHQEFHFEGSIQEDEGVHMEMENHMNQVEIEYNNYENNSYRYQHIEINGERRAYGYYKNRGYFVMPLGYILNASNQQCPRLFRPVECKVTFKRPNGELATFEIEGSNRCAVAKKIRTGYLDEGFEFVSSECKYKFMRPIGIEPIDRNKTLICPQVYAPVVCEVKLLTPNGETEYKVEASNKCFAKAEVMKKFPDSKILEMKCERGYYKCHEEMKEREFVYSPKDMEKVAKYNSNMKFPEKATCLVKFGEEGTNETFTKVWEVEDLLQLNKYINSVQEDIKTAYFIEARCKVKYKEKRCKENYEGHYNEIVELRKKYRSKDKVLEEIMEIKAKIRYVNDPLERRKLEMKLKLLEERLKELTIMERKNWNKTKIESKERKVEINEKIKEIQMKKEEIKNKIMEKEKEVKKKIKEIKERIIKKLREKRKLDPEDKQEVINLIKNILKLKFEKLQLKIVILLDNLNNNEGELLRLLQSLENENATIESNMDVVTQLEALLADIEEAKAKLKDANSVTDLKMLVKTYLEIKFKLKAIKQELNLNIENQNEASTN